LFGHHTLIEVFELFDPKRFLYRKICGSQRDKSFLNKVENSFDEVNPKLMKAVLTFYALIFFGLLINAQEPLTGNQIEIVDVQLTFEEKSAEQVKKRLPKRGKVARFYLFKNSRVKKELSFRTKRNKSKLA